jgi:hypothetical protein
VEADREDVPVKFQFQTQLQTITMTPNYSPSPNPAPGDRRRMISVDVLAITGTNRENSRIDLDYQDVDGFHLPHHVSYTGGGVFDVPLELTECSVALPGTPSR